MADIDSVEALERVNGATPPQMHLKVIDHLDTGALRWLENSPLAIIGLGGPASIGVTLSGGAAGFAAGSARKLILPLDAFDAPEHVASGTRFGSLFLIPGIAETLRINGSVTAAKAGRAVIAVEEVYGHCGKALIRSEFWQSGAAVATPTEPRAFASASRFLGLATINANGQADLSPKGDPAGFMATLEGDTLWFADRPGNRRVDSFRNIIERPNVALALVVPSSTKIALVNGRARLTTDNAVRSRFEVQGKLPKLVTGVAVERFDLRESGSLARAELWPVRTRADINPAKLFLDHVKANRVGGVAAVLSRSLLSVPGAEGLVRKGLANDYRDNLY